MTPNEDSFPTQLTVEREETDIYQLVETDELDYAIVPPIYLEHEKLLPTPDSEDEEEQNTAFIDKLKTSGLDDKEISVVILHTGCGKISDKLSVTQIAELFNLPSPLIQRWLSSGMNKVIGIYSKE